MGAHLLPLPAVLLVLNLKGAGKARIEMFKLLGQRYSDALDFFAIQLTPVSSCPPCEPGAPAEDMRHSASPSAEGFPLP